MHILLSQDVLTRSGIEPALMQRDYPRTYAYLTRFERQLRQRAAYRKYQHRRAFYSMYNVGSYTLASIKVVWRRLDRRISAAVVDEVDDPLLGRRPAVPQETCVLIACESATEAHYVCAVLNSELVNFLIGAHSVRGSKGFGTPGTLDFVKLKRFDPQQPLCRELAGASQLAHHRAAACRELVDVQRRIDELTAELWGLSHRELEAIVAE
jgi:hypothetical protein